jgi:hypothetical protein
MSDVFQNIDPPPPGECVSPAFGAGGGHTRRVERGGGSIFWKTPDTALYPTFVSTLWLELKKDPHSEPKHIIVVDLIFLVSG